jgi:hypothetical protein
MNPQKTSTRHSFIEILEARVAPAPIVTATFAGGVLTLTGDGGDSDCTVLGNGAETYLLVGNGGTVIVLNGAPGAGSAALDAPIASIQAQLGAGADILNLNFVTMTGLLNVEGGDGNDSLTFNNTSVGAVKFIGGNDDDSFIATGALAKFNGPMTIDLGDGANSFAANGVCAVYAGLVTVKGGTGADTIAIVAPSATFAKGITAFLGGGNNGINIAGIDVRIGGPVTVVNLDHLGTAAFNISGSSALTIQGGVTISTGTGGSSVAIGGGLLEMNGAFKMIGSADADLVTVICPGTATIKGGINLSLGDGANSVTIAGTNLTTGTISVTAGSGLDSIGVGGGSTRTGAFTLSLGSGNNSVMLGGTELRAGGLIKITAGPGDDTVSMNVTDLRAAKGVTFDAGDGVNSLTAAGGVFQSGPINVLYGEHAAGISVLNFGSSSTSITGPVKLTGKGGAESLNIGSLAFSSGPITAALGNGANASSLTSPTARIGGLTLSGGADNDVLSLSCGELTLGFAKLALGGATNTVNMIGNSLFVGGAFAIASGSGDDSITSMTAHARLAKGLLLDLGDGVNGVTFNNQSFHSGGAVTYKSGNHASGTSVLSITALSVNILGPVSATFAGGDSNVSLDGTAPGRIASVKMVSGAGNDSLSLQAAAILSVLNVGSVSFNGGDGTNGATVSLAGGTVGAIKYLGGTGNDSLTVSPDLGFIASVTANFGPGAATANLGGTAKSRFGAVNLLAANAGGEAASIGMQNSVFAGSVTIKTGDGADLIIANDIVVTGAFSISTAGGADLIGIESLGIVPSFFRGPVSISTGADNDTLAIGANTAIAHAEFKASVKFDGGGGGADIAHVSAANFANTYIAGQPTVAGFETSD